MVERGKPLDHRGRARRHRREAALHHQLLLDVPGLLPPHRRLYAGVEGHGQVQGSDRASAELARGSRLQEQARGRDRLGRNGCDADPGDGQGHRAHHHAAALADLFPHRPQRHRNRRDAAAVAGRREVDPRNHAAQDPVRPGRLHPQDLRGAGSRQEGFAVRGRSLSRQGFRHRHPLHAEIPAVAAAHRLHSGRRPVPGHQVRQGFCRHRRDRPLHREGHFAEIRQRARGRHHRHRDRLQPLRQWRHRLRRRRQEARFRRHRDLSRHDVHRRTQSGLGVRLFPRQLDLARRPRRRLRLPDAQAHERHRRAARWCRSSAPKTTTCRCCPGSMRRISIPAT